MSAVKFQCASYKLFELASFPSSFPLFKGILCFGKLTSHAKKPDYHPQKPIILGVDDRLESPETVTLRYEEAARAGNGGDPTGDSPPKLLDMAAYGKAQLPSMHGYESTRYQDASYDQYQAPSFPDQQTDKFAQLNQQSFGANNAVAPYLPTPATVLSCQPATGMFGTKVLLKVSSQYDLFSMSSPMPYFSLLFGSEKVLMQDVTKESQDGAGVVYSCSADAPQHLVTGCSSNSVPLSLVIEGPSGEEISRTVAGNFQYLDGSGDDITRDGKVSKEPVSAATVDQPTTSPKAGDAALASDANTNTYEYPAHQGQYGNSFQQPSNDMITTYRTSNYTEPHFHRRPAHGWSTFGSTLGSSLGGSGRSPIIDHAGITGRSGLTPLSMPSSRGGSSGTPQLIRTSTLSTGGASAGAYPHISMYPSKAVLKINGRLETMADHWTTEEWDNKRRIVMFRKTQTASTITASFRAVSVNDRPPHSICISCIWWEEKGQCYVTSVDTIYLLEQLVQAPGRFSVEEKNRIRRNLEGFHPVTVSKQKKESEDFFKIIMAFPHPKPRNIEKDVKVFPWTVLEAALKKIIGKYSASPSSSMPTSSLMSHSASSASYTPLPTPPGGGMAAQQSLPSQISDSHSQYSMHSSHHDTIPSPRSLSGSQPGWVPYTTCAPTYPAASTRTLSPTIRHASPQHHVPSMRALPSVTTYDSRSVSAGAYGATGIHTPISHHPSTATPPRWEPSSAGGYADGYPNLSAHSHHSQSSQSVYGASGYGEGAPRA
ncbi:hypothetical protein B0I35DRAFT_406641 [Stachybotrys elegans]|uniref:DUF7082 domain-containing protein n=1 Tax=Stachybotrys elegans TaxID=80388 RepID=A0A8K0T1H9_9HYPO|nr:hypothetical protein B0I35DRAFT_406641 [Stachybotrys elegans]